jgi:hypothetical protein
VVLLWTVVCDAVVGLLGGGVLVVCVTVAVVTPVVLVAPLAVDVVVCEALAFAVALSGGTSALDRGRVTVACASVAESLDASDPTWAGPDVDLTAMPTPKPPAIAITSSAPNSHHRRSMFPPSLDPVPSLIVVGGSSGEPAVTTPPPEPIPCQPAR